MNATENNDEDDLITDALVKPAIAADMSSFQRGVKTPLKLSALLQSRSMLRGIPK